MNKIIISGNLVDKPTGTKFENGGSVSKFVIAVNSIHKNSDGEREAQYFNVIAWNGLAETCMKYLEKGKKVIVCGEAQNRKYINNDGETKYIFEIIAKDVEFLNNAKKEIS